MTERADDLLRDLRSMAAHFGYLDIPAFIEKAFAQEIKPIVDRLERERENLEMQLGVARSSLGSMTDPDWTYSPNEGAKWALDEMDIIAKEGGGGD